MRAWIFSIAASALLFACSSGGAQGGGGQSGSGASPCTAAPDPTAAASTL